MQIHPFQTCAIAVDVAYSIHTTDCLTKGCTSCAIIYSCTNICNKQNNVISQISYIRFFWRIYIRVCAHINTHLALTVEKYNCQTWEMQAINNVEVSAPSPFSTWREFLIVTIDLNSMKEEYITNLPIHISQQFQQAFTRSRILGIKQMEQHIRLA